MRGKAGNVVDRLLGIERRALAAGIVEHVDDVAAQPHHAAFEHGEQADRPRAYDDDVGLMRMSGGHGPNVAKRSHKIKGLIARPGMELALSSDDGCQRQLRRVPARAARAARPRHPAAHVRQDRRVLRRRDVRDGDRQHALPAGRRRQPGGLRGSPRPLRPSTTRRAAAPSTSPSGARRSGCSTNPTSLSPGRGSRWRRRAGSRPSADGRRQRRSGPGAPDDPSSGPASPSPSAPSRGDRSSRASMLRSPEPCWLGKVPRSRGLADARRARARRRERGFGSPESCGRLQAPPVVSAQAVEVPV